MPPSENKWHPVMEHMMPCGDIEADPGWRAKTRIHRRDGLFAYNLAVVVDDHFRGDGIVAAQI